MKIKRLVTGLTAGAVSVAMLTGCSEAELRYLNYTKEISQWTVMGGSGDMTIELDKDTIAEFMNDVAAMSGGTGESILDADDIPFERISLVYDVSVDYENNKYDINMDIGVDDNEPYKVNFYMDTEKMIFDKSILTTVKNFMADNDLYESDILYSIEYLNEYLEDKDGIEITFDYDPFMNTDPALTKEVMGVVADFMMTAFDGYTTSTFELNDTDTVTAKFNYDNVVKATADLFEYYINNSDKINTEWADFSAQLADIFEKAYPEEFDGTEFLESFRLPSADEIKEMYESFNSLVNNKSFSPVKDMLMGSEYGFDVKKNSDGSFISDSYMDLNYKGESMMKIKVNEDSRQLDQFEVKYHNPVNIIDDESVLGENYKKWLDINYPVNNVEIAWDKGREYGIISFIRAGDYRDIDTARFINIDDSIYVPIRTVAEGMGYSVQWDEENSKAYILDGDTKYDIATIMVDDTTFVKIRDFEKLGMRVDYSENHGARGMVRCIVIIDNIK